eukprot:COSAG04_NODE_1466_length_6601_cov_4.336973_5_plen_326_part_00
MPHLRPASAPPARRWRARSASARTKPRRCRPAPRNSASPIEATQPRPPCPPRVRKEGCLRAGGTARRQPRWDRFVVVAPHAHADTAASTAESQPPPKPPAACPQPSSSSCPSSSLLSSSSAWYSKARIAPSPVRSAPRCGRWRYHAATGPPLACAHHNPQRSCQRCWRDLRRQMDESNANDKLIDLWPSTAEGRVRCWVAPSSPLGLLLLPSLFLSPPLLGSRRPRPRPGGSWRQSQGALHAQSHLTQALAVLVTAARNIRRVPSWLGCVGDLRESRESPWIVGRMRPQRRCRMRRVPVPASRARAGPRPWERVGRGGWASRRGA